MTKDGERFPRRTRFRCSAKDGSPVRSPRSTSVLTKQPIRSSVSGCVRPAIGVPTHTSGAPASRPRRLSKAARKHHEERCRLMLRQPRERGGQLDGLIGPGAASALPAAWRRRARAGRLAAAQASGGAPARDARSQRRPAPVVQHLPGEPVPLPGREIGVLHRQAPAGAKAALRCPQPVPHRESITSRTSIAPSDQPSPTM